MGNELDRSNIGALAPSAHKRSRSAPASSRHWAGWIRVLLCTGGAWACWMLALGLGHLVLNH